MSIRSVLLLLLVAPSCTAQNAYTILGLPLGITREGGEVDQLYEEKLKPKIISSVLRDNPYPHIETRMKDDVEMELHFSSKGTGRKLFWIWHSKFYSGKAPVTAASVFATIEKQYGQPVKTFNFEGHEGKLLLFRKGVPASPNPQSLADKDFDEFLGGDYQFRVQLLGKDFQGVAVTVFSLHGNVLRVVTELIDHPLAASVLNPGK